MFMTILRGSEKVDLDFQGRVAMEGGIQGAGHRREREDLADQRAEERAR
jgi:hypothetical protein